MRARVCVWKHNIFVAYYQTDLSVNLMINL